MKKNGLLFGLVIALTALNFQAFAAGETETDGTVIMQSRTVRIYTNTRAISLIKIFFLYGRAARPRMLHSIWE